MQILDTILTEIKGKLEALGAAPEDADELAESRRDRLMIDSDGAACALDRTGRIVRSSQPAAYLTAEIVGGAPAGVFVRRRVSDEDLAAKRAEIWRHF